jgi:transposase
MRLLLEPKHRLNPKEEREMGRPLQKLDLNEQERQTLQAWCRRGRTNQALAMRARIILLAAEGVESIDVAGELGLSNQTICKWRSRFLKERLVSLGDAERSGAPRSIQDEKIQAVVDTTLHKKPKQATHWSSRLMAKELGLSQTAIVRIWHTFGLQPHRRESFKLSTDPHFVAKVRDIVGLYLNPPVNAIVLSVDEKSQMQALDHTQPSLPLRPGQVERGSHDYKRHGTTALFAALDIASGEVISQFHAKHRSQEFLKFLNLLDVTVPRRSHQQIHLILDNYATHKTPRVKRWLLKHPYIHLHFTPTSSSWINLVERLFAEVEQKKLRRGCFTSVAHLESEIAGYLKSRNKNPTPFVWTAPAELILKRVLNVIQSTSNSGH